MNGFETGHFKMVFNIMCESNDVTYAHIHVCVNTTYIYVYYLFFSLFVYQKHLYTCSTYFCFDILR